ncbi:hypothetical protein, partial [Sphingobium yanoikuyae]|uniref:hypothetical protein n=1 Tax=Sphingobium yanoikuyae TaxID=13690 RepID=UPI00242EF64F
WKHERQALDKPLIAALHGHSPKNRDATVSDVAPRALIEISPDGIRHEKGRPVEPDAPFSCQR